MTSGIEIQHRLGVYKTAKRYVDQGSTQTIKGEHKYTSEFSTDFIRGKSLVLKSSRKNFFNDELYDTADYRLEYQGQTCLVTVKKMGRKVEKEELSLDIALGFGAVETNSVSLIAPTLLLDNDLSIQKRFFSRFSGVVSEPSKELFEVESQDYKLTMQLDEHGLIRQAEYTEMVSGQSAAALFPAIREKMTVMATPSNLAGFNFTSIDKIVYAKVSLVQ